MASASTGALSFDDNSVLPALRQDLRLIDSAPGPDGLRQWKIHDPLAQRFFEIDATVVALLNHWSAANVGALRAAVIGASAGLDAGLGADSGTPPGAGALAGECSLDTVARVLQFLQQHELIETQPGSSLQRIQQQQRARQRSPWQRLLHGYLFIKLPLARPDAFLRRSLPWVSLFFTPAFWFSMLGVGLLGLYLVSRQWAQFSSTLPQMVAPAGLALFSLSLAFVKTLHELGHGYCAVRLGSRVSTMGVAFIVMVPVLYTDTTDAWRLRTRRERVLIDAAGMAVELAVAACATLAWVFLPEGPLRHAAFALATTAWVLSLAVNLNPLMRFDGYYLFSDLLGTPNLQERSFAMARWWLRETLFDLGDPPPEPAPRRRRLFWVAFAMATWLYRFFLFLAIALLVYHFFFKVLGVFLFAVEMGWFIVLPIWRELQVWWRRRLDFKARVRWPVALLGTALLAAAMPWPHAVRIPAVLSAQAQLPVFAPRAAQVEAVLVQRGDRVKAGQALIRLSAPELDRALAQTHERSGLLEERLARRSADAADLSDSLLLAGELGVERERQTGLQRVRGELLVLAAMDGEVAQLAEELHAGRWVNAQTPLALLIAPQQLAARGYVDGDDIGRIETGQEAHFVDEARMHPALPLTVQRIAVAASEHLDHWLLASPFGGPVPARLEKQRARPEHAVFEVAAISAALNPAPGPQGSAPNASTWASAREIRGEIVLRGSAQSLLARAWRRVVQVLVREWSA